MSSRAQAARPLERPSTPASVSTFTPASVSTPTPASAFTSISTASLAERAVGLTVLSSLVLLLGIAWLAPVGGVVLRFVPDDGFYYLEIARRLGLGQGSTFDGINPTNGYHPLWLLLLVPFASMMDASREAGVRLAMGGGVLLLGTAFFFVWRVAKRLAPGQAHLAVLFAWASLAFASIYGMESALAAALLGLLLWRLTREQGPRSFWNGAGLGLVAGLLVLARLDSAPYVLAMNGALALRAWSARAGSVRERGWYRLVGALLAQGLVVAPYFAANLVLFGHLFTVSSLAKLGRLEGPNLLWARSFLALLGLGSAGMAGLCLLLGCGEKTGPGRAGGQLALRTAAGGTLLSMGLLAWKGGFETFNWYFTLPVLCGGLFLAVLTAAAGSYRWRGRPVRAPLRALAVAGCLLILGVTVGGKLKKPPVFAEQYARAAWIAVNAPREAVFAEPDCGILGYMSERPFLNTDGLTNSFAFQEASSADRLPAWFADAGLNSLALPVEQPPLAWGDGAFRAKLTVRRAWNGHQPRVFAVLEPGERMDRRGELEPGERTGRRGEFEPGERTGQRGPYELWRVVRVENGPVPVPPEVVAAVDGDG